MDTLSRDSNSSGSILPLVGVIAGGLALVLSIAALFKFSTLQKTVTDHGVQIEKIPALESKLDGAIAKSESDIKGLRSGVQTAFDQFSTTIGTIQGQLTKIDEQLKARAAAPAPKGGAAVATGVMNADGTYSVAPKDTLSKIAKKFAVRMDAIEAENPGLDPTKLHVGQKIKIPKK